MKDGSVFQKRQLARKNRLRLKRQTKGHALRRTEGAWIPGSKTYSGKYPEVAKVESSRGREYHEIQAKKAKRAKRRAEEHFAAAENLVRTRGKKK